MYGFFSESKIHQKSETIKKLLSDKNTKIEDLLREEDLLQDLEDKNEDLIKYFDKTKVKQLIDYIIKEPQIDSNNPNDASNKDKGYKFPFKCSQIFDLENKQIFKYFFMTNKEIEEESKNELENKGNDKDKNPENKEGAMDTKIEPEQKEEIKEEKNKEDKEKTVENDEEKENDEKESNDNRIELIDYLFTFFPEEFEEGKELNY